MDDAARRNPYPGLRPFQADETELFFGRDEQRIELLQRLRRSRFLAIVGTSGSGKSSLVRAGLLPGLHGGFMAGQSDRWRVVDLRPGTDAIGNLARALDAPGVLCDALPAEDEPSFTEATLRRSGLGLVEAVREARLPHQEKVLVLVDQFEELFRAIEATDRPQSNDDAEAFVKLLLEAAKQDELPIHVVLTMRSDFLGECTRFRNLPEAINDGQYLVPRLTPDQRRDAITGPAAVFGAALSSTLVNRLLNDVGEDPDQLPILQHALMRSWDAWQRGGSSASAGREIGLADYEAIGGMARALSLHADAIFESLTDGRSPKDAALRKAIAEKLFKSLARTDAGGSAVRRFASLQDIVDVTGAPLAEVVSVIEAFRAPGHSFLMPPAGEPLTPERFIDISHESLIRNWVRMKTWVVEEAESARVYERLSSTAVLHEKGEAGLWDQPDLGVALKWRDTQTPNPAWAQRYNATFGPAMAFLDASHARVRAADEKKARRRRLWTFTAAVVVVAMLTVLLSSVQEELARADALSRHARETSDQLRSISALLTLHRARASGTLTGDALSLCRETVAAGSSMRHRLWTKLCDPAQELERDEQELIAFYQQLLDGRWSDAGQAISQMGSERTTDEGKALLAQLAATQWPTDRAEHSLLLVLRTQGAQVAPDDAQRVRIANLVHPVHRKMAAILTQQSGLSPEETLLLEIYQLAAAMRSSGASFYDRQRARENASGAIEQLRLLPQGQLYAATALSALTQTWKVIESLETGQEMFGEYAFRTHADVLWPVWLTWPLWRVWRFVQHRRRKPVRARPHPIRRASAALWDLTIALGVGVLTNTVVASAIRIAGFLLGFSNPSSRLAEETAFTAALVAFTAYMLCRDATRLRFRRSLGKALFDLRPYVIDPTGPRTMTVLASIRRNAVWLFFNGTVFLALQSFIENSTLLSYLLLGCSPIWIFLLVDVIRSWLTRRDTLLDKWSRTRVIDAGSADAVTIPT